MKTRVPSLWLTGQVSTVLVFAPAAFVAAQNAPIWEAFNDYRPSATTHVNATGYDLRVTDEGGPLKSYATGSDLNASVRVLVEGGDTNDFGANSPVNPGSPADLLFGGIVDVGNEGLPGVGAAGAIKLSLFFEGLNPARRYVFRGTVSRGGNYNDRWSVFGIAGTEAHVVAHVDGSTNQNVITKVSYPAAALGPDQVAMNTGDNKVGSLIGWDNIEPGGDGTFVIEAQQYTGPAPFGNPSAAPYAYGFNAIYLAEIQSTGELRITENPAVHQIVPAGDQATLEVEASSPQAITYQWQKAAPGSDTFEDVDGATSATYTTPPLEVADHGSRFQCRVESGGFELLSGEGRVDVDGEIPRIVSVEGSVSFDSLYMVFSEPMKLGLLGELENYSIDGGLSLEGVVVRDSVTVRLLTSLQPKGATYEVSVRDVEDLAGNSVDPGESTTFKTYSYAVESVGLEVWENLGGGAIVDLRNSPLYPDQPDVDYLTSAVDSTLVFADGPNNTYGGRFRAWLLPEETGEYHFFLRADDNGEFAIAPGSGFDALDDPGRLPDAVATGNAPFQEPGVDQSTSAPIHLEAGTPYAVQVLWKESNGGDRAQLAWRRVEDTTPADQLEPIPSSYFIYFGSRQDDSDGDGMADAYEVLNGLDPDSDDADGDLDSDGLSNKEEYDQDTAANVADTDGDGLEDGVETGSGVWVNESDTGTHPLRTDSDGDMLGDGAEVDGGTDPTKADTDDDGYADNVEYALGTDPSDSASRPVSIIAVANGPWDAETTWSDGLPPRSSAHYAVVGGVTASLDTVAGSFGGRSLTLVGPGVTLECVHSDSASVDLIVNNAELDAEASNTLDGTLDLRGQVSFDLDLNNLVVAAALKGAPLLTLMGDGSDVITGSVELTGSGSDFGGLITVQGTSLIGRAPGSLGSGSITLAGGALTFGYEYDNPEALLQIQGGEFRLALDADVVLADVVGLDAGGTFLFSVFELAGPGPYTADDLLALFQLTDEISGTGILTLTGNTHDTDYDGLPDSWETDNFGDLQAAPGGDPDADGRINLAEFHGDTDPNVWDAPDLPDDPGPSGDEPVIGSITKDASGVSLSFPPGTEFDVEYSEDLENWIVIATGVTGEYVDSDPDRNARASGYYRGVTGR